MSWGLTVVKIKCTEQLSKRRLLTFTKRGRGSEYNKLAPATSAVMQMLMANANANPVGCGSEDGPPDELVIASEAQPHDVHAAPVALRICAMNRV